MNSSRFTYTVSAILVIAVFTSCASQQKISKKITKAFEQDSIFQNAFVGVSVFNTATNQYLYNFNGTNYFVPASNVKLPTLYAGLKYLGKNLPGVKYTEQNDTLFLQPTGDPTFLHTDYKNHPVYDFLKQTTKTIIISDASWKAEALGYGWAWDDYLGYYMAERSPMPIYGNTIKWIQQRTIENKNGSKDTSFMVFTDPEINWDVKITSRSSSSFNVTRPRTENTYTITEGKEMKRELEIPFVTNGIKTTVDLLKDTLHKQISSQLQTGNLSAEALAKAGYKLQTIYSQPADSMLKPLMHRSDNFFAEQTLLMVSNELLGYMDEQKLIDNLLKTDLNGFPQKPKWLDGSGLSRYNLFTPQDFVWLLLKLKDEFGLERMKNLIATGNEGTLRNYYKEEAGYIFAKTGTLSGHVALSGYLITEKNQLLVFSVLVNNHTTSSTAVRRSVELFIKKVRKQY